MQNIENTRVKITAIKSGPLLVEGLTEILNSDKETLKEADKIYLCRCGSSSSKPFCDGTHRKIGFDQ